MGTDHPGTPRSSSTDLLLDLLEQEFSEGKADNFAGPGGERVPFELWKAALYGPLRDFLGRPGVEFRARFVEAAWKLGAPETEAPTIPPELPLLVEILHLGSLIIDDIEDGSAFRRGDRVLHHAVGIPLAINAANWLYFWPELLLPRMDLRPETELRLRRSIGRTLHRCHNGQALDLSVRVYDLTRAQVHDVVATTTGLKTGSLFELAAVVGAIGAGASDERVRAIAAFGNALGVGLQMLDDLSGFVNEERYHKGHEDLLGARPTWPWAWVAADLGDDAYGELAKLGRLVASRDKHPETLAGTLRDHLESSGPERTRAHFEKAKDDLCGVVGSSDEVELLGAEVDLVERTYLGRTEAV